MKIASRLITSLLLLTAACSSSSLAMPEPSLAPSRTAVLPSATLTASATPSAPPEEHSPTPAPLSTATFTPSLTPSPTPLVKDSVLVYRPDHEARSVVTVRWADNNRQIYYALSPIHDEYLLKWNSFDLSTQGSRPIISPFPAYMDEWAALGLGYPDNSKIYSELLGFASPTGKYLIFPNAGFPNIFTNPNNIYLIPAESGDRDQILGPTFRGTVGKVYWLDYESMAVFDYRFSGGVLIFLTDLRSKITRTLVDLTGTSPSNTDWSVAPNQSVIFLPAQGTSQIISLTSKPIYTFQTPRGVVNPVWARYSQAIYFWENGSNLLKRYYLGSEEVETVLALNDLDIHAPVTAEWGMPFAVSPDEKSIAFWHEDWIWTVKIK